MYSATSNASGAPNWGRKRFAELKELLAIVWESTLIR